MRSVSIAKTVWETTYDKVKLNRLFSARHISVHCKPPGMLGAVFSNLI